MSSTFKLLANFKAAPGEGVGDVTRAEIRMSLGATNVTEFVDLDDRRVTVDHLDIPAYYLAEWIAENWWPLLYEPRKSEDSHEDSPDFLSRHSFLTAQHGFSLPGIKIVSNGRRAIYVSAAARNVPYAGIRFSKTASLMLSPDSVMSELRSFVGSTVRRLEKAKLSGTELQEAWQAVEETAADEEAYCKMIGALGLSPYAENDAVDQALFRLVDKAGERVALDLCLVARPEEFAAYVDTALSAYSEANGATKSDLSPLLGVQLPPDNLLMPAWKRGVLSAARVREKLGLSDKDPRCGFAYLDALGMHVKATASSQSNLDLQSKEEGMPIVGAVVRDDAVAQIGLLQTTGAGRRFAAARASFAAWISAPQETRLLTQAVTRDQQSSRAFAAEMLAPIAFLRQQAGKGLKLFGDQVSDLADELGVSPGLVRKQAENNGIVVSTH